MKYFEDVVVGEEAEFGEHTMTKEGIVEFAERYDPQPFHLEEEAAEESFFGELCASGWHTAVICMRLAVEHSGENEARLAGVGVDDLRWHRPVLPGDTISCRQEIVGKRRSESRPERGYVDARMEGFNQDGDLVVSYVGTALFACREADAGGGDGPDR